MVRDKFGRFDKGNTSVTRIKFDENKVVKMYKDGFSILCISEKLGYSRESTRIGNLIRSLGISHPSGFQKGDKHPGWKNGFKKTSKYMMKRFNNSYILEHSFNWCVANKILTVPIGHEIHHLNLDSLDNRPENLMLLPRDIHRRLHLKINPRGKYMNKTIIRGD